MEWGYENWDRKTRRHFDRMHTDGPHLGMLLTTPEHQAENVQQDLQEILGEEIKVRRKHDQVFFSGPKRHILSEDLRTYLRRDHITVEKALQSTYEFFPVTPDHLLERIMRYPK